MRPKDGKNWWGFVASGGFAIAFLLTLTLRVEKPPIETNTPPVILDAGVPPTSSPPARRKDEDPSEHFVVGR